MKRLFFLSVVILALACPAFAREPIQQPTPVEDYNPPSVTACTAYAANNQACRNCQNFVDRNGNEIPDSKYCAFVTESAACSCVNNGSGTGGNGTGCVGNRGACTYHG